MKPLISVLTPVYNGEAFIKRCYECITMQTYQKWEWVVVNDGSTDKTGELLLELAEKDSRIKLISYCKNMGRGYARRKAIENCSGDWTALWDIDDLYFPERFDCVVKACEDGYDFLCSYAVLITNRLDIKGCRGFHKLLDDTIFIHATLCVKSDIFKSIGYDERFKAGEDFTMMVELKRKYKGFYYKDFLLIYQEEREVFLNKSISSNFAHLRQLKKLYRDKAIKNYRQLTKYRLIYLIKLLILNCMRVYPPLYLKTVSYRDNGSFDKGILSDEKKAFIEYFKSKYVID